MPFTFGKSDRRAPDLPGEWVGWLEPGVEVEGKMTVAAGLIRVNSHFKGQIQSQGMVVVHDQGEVEGEIHTRLISITGKVKGNIHAVERLEIKEHGVVNGDIDTPCLVVEPGGFFDGQCRMPAPEPAPRTPTNSDPKDQPQTP
jgi:cytoskeletal protein CcmA (bactofilin family)